MSYLDRANIGNAKSGGSGEHALDTPAPSYFLSTLCFVWGGVAACMAAATNYQALAGIRFCLGVVEAGFAPGIAFYLSSWYKRHELAKRYSIYYTATAVSGAFSGLLAGVITDHLALARGIEGWQWLLIIEGVGSSFVACFTWYILRIGLRPPHGLLPRNEYFIAVQRLAYDGIGGVSGKDAQYAEPTHGEALKMAITDWRTWCLSVMYMLATGSQTIQYFIPTLVGQLGYTGYSKQFMTIPIYAVALVFILFFCFLSDIRQERGNYVTITSFIAGISFIVCVSVSNEHVKYAFLCFAVGGVYACCPLTLLWVSGIIDHPAEKRAVAIALVNGLGNSASIYGTFLWPSTTGPRYVQGFATTTAFVLLLGILAQILKLALKKYPSQALHYEAKTADGKAEDV
ncbi:MFS general substrate transporter [Hymenopellis radicata]|nr:MFS general substrate transporter [Hymenopellis radicata]